MLFVSGVGYFAVVAEVPKLHLALAPGSGLHLSATNRTAASLLLQTSPDLSKDWNDAEYLNPGASLSLITGLSSGATNGFFRLIHSPLPPAGKALVNTGFETGAEGWTGSGEGVMQPVSQAFSGFHALRLQRTGAGSLQLEQAVPDAQVKSGNRLVIKVWIKPGTNCNSVVSLGVRYLNAAGEPGEITAAPVSVTAPSGWMLLALSTNVPAGAHALVVFLEADGSAVDFTADDFTAVTWPDVWWHKQFAASFDGTGNYTAPHLSTLNNTASSFLAVGFKGLWDVDLNLDQNWGQSHLASFNAQPDVKRLVYIEGQGSDSVICRTSADGKILTTANEFHLLNSTNPSSRAYIETSFTNGGSTIYFSTWQFMNQTNNWLTRRGNPLPTPQQMGLSQFTDPLDGSPVLSEESFWQTRTGRPLFDPPDDPDTWMTISNAALHADLATATSTNEAGQWRIKTRYGMILDEPYARYQAATARRAMDVLDAGMIHYDDWSLGAPSYGDADADIYRAAFCRFVRERWSDAQCADFGFTRATVDSFDVVGYLRSPPWRGEYANNRSGSFNCAKDVRWLSNLVWRSFQLAGLEGRRQAQELVFRLNKQNALEMGGQDIPMVANVIPTLGAFMLQQHMVDMPNFEWPLMKTYGVFPEPFGYYPQARPGIGPRMAVKISTTGHAMVNPYVEPQYCGWDGAGYTNRTFETLHKVIYFDLIANRGIPTFALTFDGMFSPGSIYSAGQLHTFIKATTDLLSKRAYIADIGLAMSGWSKVAESTIFGSTNNRAGEEVGWAEYFARSTGFPQWDVLPFDEVMPDDLSRFKLVVLPSLLVLTESNLVALTDYLSLGGRLLVTGRTGEYDGPDGFLMPRSTDVIGSLATNFPGQVFRTLDKPGLAYQTNPGEAERQVLDDLLAAASAYVPALTAVNAPTNICIHLNESIASPGEITVDMVNVNYTLETDTLTPVDQPGFQVRLSIPHFSEEVPLSVEAIRYDESSENNTVVETVPASSFGFVSGQLVIEIPAFDSYQILRIRRSGQRN